MLENYKKNKLKATFVFVTVYDYYYGRFEANVNGEFLICLH